MEKLKCKLGGKVPSGGLPCLMCGYLNSTVVSGWKCEYVEDQDKSKRMKVITLCGSTKFKEQFLEQQKRLTLEGDCGYVECECIPDSDYVEDVE